MILVKKKNDFVIIFGEHYFAGGKDGGWEASGRFISHLCLDFFLKIRDFFSNMLTVFDVFIFFSKRSHCWEIFYNSLKKSTYKARQW